MLKFATATVLLGISAAGAEPESLKNYLHIHRAALLDDGWQPLPKKWRGSGVDVAPGASEVVCGSAVCTADWLDPSGKQVTFDLYIDGTEKRYAP